MSKLQELTDRLFNEGLSKGKEEGEALLAKAKRDADKIVNEAKKEAEDILARAQKQAEDLDIKVKGDLRIAASQAIQATKKDIENIVVVRLADSEVSKSLRSAEFVKTMLISVAEKFNVGEPVDLNLVLPEALRSDLEPFVKNEMGKILKSGVEAGFSKKISGGFTIGPKDGGYFVSFTEETFKELISAYLRPATKKLLFGE